jgi:iron complex outermembrane receptor protein
MLRAERLEPRQAAADLRRMLPLRGCKDFPPQAHGGKISNTDARIPSISYIDLSVDYHVTDKVELRFGCNNLFDRDPPVVGSDNLPSPPVGNGNTMPGTYDWGGRFVFGELSATF